ncbi:MAG: hypothetical protein U0872_09000 [Planctomycetaceae bacterium]
MLDNGNTPVRADWRSMCCLTLVDADFGKQQLKLSAASDTCDPTRQIPRTTEIFSDVNPPVHAYR